MNTEAICMPGHDAFEVTNLFSGNRYPAQWFLEWASGGTSSDSGVTVNGYTALTHCPLWQGVNIIAGDIGQVPIRLVRNEFNEQKQHAAWNLLRVRPNDLQTPSVFKETLMQWALIWGNFVGWIVRRGATPVDIIPLRPDALRPELVVFDDGQQMLYHYISPTLGKEFTFFPDDVIHIQGLTGDGVWGYALHEIAKNTIGHGLALEKHGNKQFSQGAIPGGVLKHPGKLSPEAIQLMREQWHSLHGGAENAGRIAILGEAVEFQQTAQTNINAQWIEAKKLDRVNAASLLNLPAHKLNALEDSSVRSNLEEQNEVYKQMTLTRWSNRMAEEFKRKLLTDKEWKSDEYTFKFDWDAFLTADIDTLTTVADRCVKAQIMNPNEARRTIGLPPYPGGDKFANPAINPQAKEGERPAEPPENTPKPPQNRLKVGENGTPRINKEQIRNRLARVMSRERQAIKHAAVAERNFLAWLDDFYGVDGQIGEILAIFNNCMSKSHTFKPRKSQVTAIREQFSCWASDRKEQLLTLCSTATTSTLVDEVKRFGEICEINDACDELFAKALGENNGTQNH